VAAVTNRERIDALQAELRGLRALVERRLTGHDYALQVQAANAALFARRLGLERVRAEDVEVNLDRLPPEHPGRGAELTPKQMLAAGALTAGQTITDAAQAAGVDRSTVHRWLREDFNFQAALNAARRDLLAEIENRLLRLAHDAADAVGQAIEAGDVSAAIALLRGIGALSGKRPEIGLENPEELRQEDATARDARVFQQLIRGAAVSGLR
jgi:hypothetical protein